MEKDKSKIYFVSLQYLDSITTFSITEGITDFNVSIIGNNPTMKTLNIPSTLKSIGTVGLSGSIETVNIDSKNKHFIIHSILFA